MSELVITERRAECYDAVVLVGRWERDGKVFEHCLAVSAHLLADYHIDALEHARRKIREAFDLSKELTA